MKPFIVVFLLAVTVFSGCSEIKPKGEKEIHAFVKEWNDMHILLKAPYLRDSYMDVVQYYGVERTNFEVEQHKEMLFEDFPDYTQQIKNNQLTITKEGGSYLVVFEKEVQYNGIEATYESYLLLTLSNSKYKILREGVANDGKHLDVPIFPNNFDRRLAAQQNRKLYGDFNGDDLSDYAYVTAPVLLNAAKTTTKAKTTALCEGACTSVIHFSAPNLTAIAVEDVYSSQLENLRDLNSDGADEIGFWDFKSNAKSLYVFNATTGTLLTPPVYINTAVHKNMKLIDVIKKTGPNKITVTRSKEQAGTWILESEIVVLD
ncbi:hypothetical protein SCB49_08903 [unidentified eubacterium SCB49]|nr:hypothetical protein SCB49_08903 [unidentified eubacterium SCB49]